jgi:hypothetical protein
VAPRRRLLALGPSGPKRCPHLHPGQAPDLPRSLSDLIETDDGYELAYICLDPVGHGHIDPAAKQTSGGSSRIGSYGAMVGQRRTHDGSP